MTDPLALALSQLTPVLEALGIRYAVVGSLASSAHGVYRATADGDLLALLAPGQAVRLAKALGCSWYADVEIIERAVRDRRSFNVIHIPTAQKIDIFPATSDFHTTQIERVTMIPVFPVDGAMLFPVASPEDVLLAKLQWNDITGLLATNQDLDFEYVNSWATRLRVEDLLAKALADVSSD
jgi:hypothetical protein